MPGEEGILGAFGRIASTMLGGAPDGAKHAWNAIAPWINELTRSATTRWLPFLVQGIPCEVVERKQPCAGAAITACGVCRHPVCIHHSFVSKGGEAVCFPCAGRAAAAFAATPGASAPQPGADKPPDPTSPFPPPPWQRRAPPPRDPNFIPSELLTAARRVLGVRKDTAWDRVERRYKKLLVEWHPDKHPSDSARATARFKEIRAAFDLLSKERAEQQKRASA